MLMFKNLKNNLNILKIEDLNTLVDQVPEDHRIAMTKLTFGMMTHPGYQNTQYVWSKDDFELGSALGKQSTAIFDLPQQIYIK